MKRGTVLLALTVEDDGQEAVSTALAKCGPGGCLSVLCVYDADFSAYFANTDIGFFPHLKEQCERELAALQRQRARKKVASIRRLARRQGTAVRSFIGAGELGARCLRLTRALLPALVIMPRARRPGWLRRFLPSAPDRVVAGVSCAVLEI